MKRAANGRSLRAAGADATTPPTDFNSGAPAEASSWNRLALAPLDWCACGLIASILVVTPIWAATFATPAQPVTFAPAVLADQGAADAWLSVWVPPLSLVLTAVAFALIAWREWRKPVAIGAVRGVTVSVVLAGAWAALSVVPWRAPHLSLNALSFLAAALLAGGLASRLARDHRALTCLALAIAGAGTIVAGLGVREYLGALREGVVDHRTFSTFGPNFLAGYLLLTLPLTMSAFASGRPRLLRLGLGLGLALQSACLFLTGSRAGTAIGLSAVVAWVLICMGIGATRQRGRWIFVGAAIFVLASALSATPILGRYDIRPRSGPPAGPVQATSSAAKPAEDTQGHSAAFRKSTWVGTVRMTLRNPVTGTGVGTFAAAYPRYADTKFTAHAHNSFLQWSAETGLVGAIALLAALASASAFVVHVLLLVCARRNSAAASEPPDGTAGLLDSPEMLLAGAVAALCAAAVHSIFDSDLYIVATLFAFCVVLGITLAQARALAPLAVEKPRAVSPGFWIAGLLVCTFIVTRGVQAGLARWDRAQVDSASSALEAAEYARSAAAADPLDPEPHLVLARMLGTSSEAETHLLAAARLSPGNRTYYLLGRYYRDLADSSQDPTARTRLRKLSIDALENARTFDPHNLQALNLLAGIYALAAAEQKDSALAQQARFTYQTMAALENAPYGRVRAVKEYIETDFAYAHIGLAELALREGNRSVAALEYGEALRVFRLYWPTRTWSLNDIMRSPEKRMALADAYVRTLGRATKIVATNDATAQALAEETAKVEADRRADEAAAVPLGRSL